LHLNSSMTVIDAFREVGMLHYISSVRSLAERAIDNWKK
jgi:hypothetical protein